MKKIFISYAGAIWCGKSPITNYISTKLWLPVFDTDAIRSEVVEDLMKFDEIEINKRIKERLNSVIEDWKSFIYDASIDRTRWILKKILIKNNYKFFIISIDLDRDTLLSFYKAKSYSESIKMVDKVYEDHQKFLKDFWEDIDMHIDIKTYKNRLKNVYRAVNKWIQS